MSNQPMTVDFGASDTFGAHLFRVEIPASRNEPVVIIEDYGNRGQEGGIPRFMVELGVMGLIAGIGLGLMMARECFKAVMACPQGSPGQPFVLGLTGLLAANGCSFLASHQIFNDLVIMVLTSFCLGAAVSGPTWCGDGPDAEQGEDDAT